MLLFVTLSLFVLISGIGLSVDFGYSYFIKMMGQAAADSAATAAAIYASKNGYNCGAGGVTCNSTFTCASPPTSPPTTAFEAGCLYAQANGYTNAGQQTVTLIANNTTPPNESGNAPSLWIQANVAQTVNHMFLYWAGFHSGSVASEAIAAVNVQPASSCVYVLSATAADALTITGSGSVTATNCGVYVDSSATSALYMTGSAKISGNAIDVHGGFNNGCVYSCTESPTPVTGAATTADPLASLAAPTVPNSCDHTNYSIASSSTATISPGVYCGGITAGGSATLNLNPGLYILNGGGFNSGNSAIVNGSGVTFFLTGQYGQTAKGMNLSGASKNYLTAPSSGTYQGILFYQDRSVTYATANSYGNSALLSGTGTLYFPTTALSLSGAIAASKIGLVVSTLSVTGSASFQQDTTGKYTGLARSAPGLIE